MLGASFDPEVLITNLGMLSSITQDMSLALGIIILGGAILKFKRYGEMRGIMSHHMSIGDPLMRLVAGALLISIPTTIPIIVSAIFGNATPLSVSNTGVDGWDQLMKAVIVLTRLIGVIAFARGVIMLARAGKEGSPPGTLGRSMIFILAGTLCIHIVGTIALLEYIVGVV